MGDDEDLDLEFADFVADGEAVAGFDLSRGFGGLAVRDDAAHVTGFGGEFTGFEEASGPEPLVDAGAGHGSLFSSIWELRE